MDYEHNAPAMVHLLISEKGNVIGCFARRKMAEDEKKPGERIQSMVVEDRRNEC